MQLSPQYQNEIAKRKKETTPPPCSSTRSLTAPTTKPPQQQENARTSRLAAPPKLKDTKQNKKNKQNKYKTCGLAVETPHSNRWFSTSASGFISTDHNAAQKKLTARKKIEETRRLLSPQTD